MPFADQTTPPHRKRFDEPGEARFLTFSCFRRQPFLTRDRSRAWLIEGIDRALLRHPIDLWAFVIMPEHVHLLVYPNTSNVDIAAFLYTMKKSVTTRALDFIRKDSPAFLERMHDLQPNGRSSYRSWQRGGGYDENLFRPRKIWEKIDYIHQNPVRRGLCNHPMDWKWSSARAFENDGDAPLTLNLKQLPVDPRDHVRL